MKKKMTMRNWHQNSRSTPDMVTGGASAVHPNLARDDSLGDGCQSGSGDGPPAPKPEAELASYIRKSITGGAKTFQGPFGRKQLVPCDALYSGCSLTFLEHYIGVEVLPMLSSSKGSTATVTTLQTAMYIDEVRNVIIKATNAGPDDDIIFLPPSSYMATPSLYFVTEICERLYVNEPVVFASEQTDEAELRPWTEVAGTIIRIPDNGQGRINAGYLRDKLEEYSQSGRPLIGHFAACSEITSTLNEDLNLTALLHLFGAIAVWDYASAAPSVHIDMNPDVPDDPDGYFCKDALFFSVCNFAGGLQSCNVLIMKKELEKKNRRERSRSSKKQTFDASQVVGIVRAGLALELKRSLGPKFIMERETELVELTRARLEGLKEIIVLTNPSTPSRSTLSFVIRHGSSNLYLHHGFVVALLSDLFGIQARTVDAGKHSYARQLFGIENVKKFEAVLEQCDPGFNIISPGLVQIDLLWYNETNENEFILDAVSFIAQHGWHFLPQYQFTKETGEWSHINNLAFGARKALADVRFNGGSMAWPDMGTMERTAFILDDAILKAKEALKNAKKVSSNLFVPDFSRLFDDSAQRVRWFLLPGEAKAMMTKNLFGRSGGAGVKCEDRLRTSVIRSQSQKGLPERRLNSMILVSVWLGAVIALSIFSDIIILVGF